MRACSRMGILRRLFPNRREQAIEALDRFSEAYLAYLQGQHGPDLRGAVHQAIPGAHFSAGISTRPSS
jgi:hypothetical protein